MANSMQALANCFSPAQLMFDPNLDLMGNVLQQRPLMEYYNSPQLHDSAPLHNEAFRRGWVHLLLEMEVLRSIPQRLGPSDAKCRNYCGALRRGWVQRKAKLRLKRIFDCADPVCL